MPSFRDAAVSQAPPEEVWKLLYDPARFPEWWAGIAAVDAEAPRERGESRFTYYPDGAPGQGMPQMLETSRDDRRIVVSCLVFDFRFEWRLEPLEGGGATRIRVVVDIPPAEASRLDAMREGIGRSVARLADLAAARA
jgi:uncharacterized protein YndB with AHSA1/START domain